MKRTVERPEPPKAEPVPQELTEQAAKHIAEQDAKQSALVPAPDVRIEQIKHPHGERLSARDVNTGKFQKKSVASTRIATNLVSDMLLAKDEETGKTELENLIDHLKSVMKNATTGKDILGISKGIELLDKMSGHEKTRNEQLTDLSDRLRQPVRTVIVVTPVGVLPMEEHPAPRTQPTWAEITELSQNPPTGKDVC